MDGDVLFLGITRNLEPCEKRIGTEKIIFYIYQKNTNGI